MARHTNSTAYFSEVASEAMAALAADYQVPVRQTADGAFELGVKDLAIVLYLYPGHVPSVNISLLPLSDQWAGWRARSVWGRTGIWLQHLVAFRMPDTQFPPTRFTTREELQTAVGALSRLLRVAAPDLLLGDLRDFDRIAAFADERVLRKQAEAKLVQVLSSAGRLRGSG